MDGYYDYEGRTEMGFMRLTTLTLTLRREGEGNNRFGDTYLLVYMFFLRDENFSMSISIP
jgi:hypothetical protein